MADIQDRKVKHLELALDENSQAGIDIFADIPLPVKSLPEISLRDVSTRTKLLGKILDQPLIIASMTGGVENALEINRNLATAAQACNVALGVGSQRAALEKPEMQRTFTEVRRIAPTAVIFANMGAIQLNFGKTVEDYKRVIDMVEADALYLHINPMQEALQPEGDIDFSGLTEKIETLIKYLRVPVWIKEVGCGLDRQSIKRLIEVGVTGIDTAGYGGTSWTWIEGRRLGNENLTTWFKNWGIPTEESLRNAKEEVGSRENIFCVASGGLRNPLQALKAHLMGADYYSAAQPFLEAAMKGPEETIKLVSDWQKGLKIAMFGCGIKQW